MADRVQDEPPPYFDALFARLEAGDPAATAAFGRHVHWGYWADPESADGSGEDYARAAEALCRAVCDAAPGGGRDACPRRGVRVRRDDRQPERAVPQPRHGRREHRSASARPRRDGPHDQRQPRAMVQADACDLPLTGPFDVVLAVECVFHFPSRASS